MNNSTTFEIGKKYLVRFLGDHDNTFEVLIKNRTAKTVITSEGKRFRINIQDGIECFSPLGNYSMSPTCKASRLIKEELAETEEAKVITLNKYEEVTTEMTKEEIEAQREEYAEEDFNILKSEGAMAITDTTYGVLWLEKMNNFYQAANNGKILISTISEKAMIAFIGESYQLA